VVHNYEEHIVVFGEPEQDDAQQRRMLQVEAAAAFLCDGSCDVLLRNRLHADCRHHVIRDVLDGASIHRHKASTQHFMAGYNGVQAVDEDGLA